MWRLLLPITEIHAIALSYNMATQRADVHCRYKYTSNSPIIHYPFHSDY